MSPHENNFAEGVRPDFGSQLHTVSFFEAMRVWFKIGCISFGGPAGQIALMHQELVEKRHWISEKRFLHALNFCMLLPGPEAQQLATYIGWLLHKRAGGIVAGVLFVLPSLCLLIALSWVYVTYGAVPWVAGIFYGLKPAVAALVIHAAYRIGKRSLQNRGLIAIALLAFFAAIFSLPFPLIIGGAALIGYCGSRFAPEVFTLRAAHTSSSAEHTLAIINDGSPIPAHARYSRARLLRTLLVGLSLWCAAMGGLMVFTGTTSVLSRMGWFFTKAALLTFGGAYAVLPYVYQGAVAHYHWLSAAQMIDGLALGETTPGPLIIVVAFVGFLGGWGNAVLGGDSLFLSGAIAACVATFFTFLPSFIFIFAGGPLIETTHGKLGFTAPLAAITAAVVGVILNLAMFFFYHVLWPNAWAGAFDGVAACLLLVAVIALFRYKLSVILFLLLCAVAGLGLRLLHLAA